MRLKIKPESMVGATKTASRPRFLIGELTAAELKDARETPVVLKELVYRGPIYLTVDPENGWKDKKLKVRVTIHAFGCHTLGCHALGCHVRVSHFARYE